MEQVLLILAKIKLLIIVNAPTLAVLGCIFLVFCVIPMLLSAIIKKLDFQFGTYVEGVGIVTRKMFCDSDYDDPDEVKEINHNLSSKGLIELSIENDTSLFRISEELYKKLSEGTEVKVYYLRGRILGKAYIERIELLWFFFTFKKPPNKGGFLKFNIYFYMYNFKHFIISWLHVADNILTISKKTYNFRKLIKNPLWGSSGKCFLGFQ